MSFQRINLKRTVMSIAIAALMGASVVDAATVRHTNWKKLTIWDLVADFDGRTFGTMGNGKYKRMLCSEDANNDGVGDTAPYLGACDEDHAPFAGNEAAMLYPIDSAFGFEVVDYTLGIQKEVGDGVWGEGFAGPIMDGTNVIGVEFSDAATDTFKVPAGLGTWCAGLGGTSVKCATEHYVAMEHVLTCHETVAYMQTADGSRANPLNGDQAVLDYIDEHGTPGTLDCATAQLRNDLTIHNSSDPVVDGKLVSEVGALGYDPADILAYLDPNESTVLDDIAVGPDFSITAKDDGKPLYRWGTLVKRPNDIRLWKRMKLPNAWKDGVSCVGLNIEPGTGRDLGCRVTYAELRINHNVTNNPNDQVRPEDMENEGAIGRLPRWTYNPAYGSGSTVSTVDCYEGDGDFIPAGIVFKNANMALGGANAISGTNPYAWSEDLHEGLSNGWYTTVDREPFEWSYDSNGDGSVDVSTRAPDPSAGDLLSGPRWRLTPGKYGQDLPGLDVANVYCEPPPYQKALIKYPVGDPIQTVLNLLDWEEIDERSVVDPDSGLPASPLEFSNGWVDNGVTNLGTEINTSVTVINPDLTGVSVNGAPVSEDFDLNIYVKGDKKPAQLYNAYLIIEYDDGNP